MKNKRAVLFLTVLMSLFALCLSACGSSGAKESDGQKYVYSAETVNKVESSTEYDAFAKIVLNGDKGYFAAGEKSDENGDTVPCISFVSEKGKKEELEHYAPVSIETGNEDKRDYRSSRKIEDLKVCPDGNLMVIENITCSWCDADSDVLYGSNGYFDAYRTETIWWIRILKDNGKEISCAKMQISEDDYVSFSSSVIDRNGNLLVSRKGGIVAVSTDGSIAYSIDSSRYIDSFATTSDGRTAALMYAGGSRLLRLVDCDSGSFANEKVTLEENAETLIDGSGEYDLYYSSGSALFGCKLNTQTVEKLFSWIDCDIYSDKVKIVSIDRKGSVRALLKTYDTGNETMVLELVDLNKEAYNTKKDKKHITLASVNPDRTMLEYIIEFNRSNKNIHVDLKDYSQYNTDRDITKGYQRLSNDITSGNVPDMLDINSNIPYDQYAAAGLFADLYPYIEKDEEFSKQDFFENVFSAMEKNGRLYMVTAGFMVCSVAGASDVVGEEPGITYDEFWKTLSSMPYGCEGFEVGFDRSAALTISVALAYDRLVDWSSRTCHFNSQEFVDILKYARKFKAFDRTKYEYSMDDDTEFRIRSGKQMLKQVSLTGVDNTILQTDLLFGGNATVTGYPTSEGVGSVIMLSGGLAITSKCSDPDAAWEFIRTFLTEEYQEKQYQIPTNKRVFEKKLAKLMEVKYEKDDEGNYVLDENGERVKKSLGTVYSANGKENVYAMSEEQARKFMETLAGATHLMSYDQSIASIITSGTQAFFAGQKTAEECAKQIQNRVYIYINERS